MSSSTRVCLRLRRLTQPGASRLASGWKRTTATECGCLSNEYNKRDDEDSTTQLSFFRWEKYLGRYATSSVRWMVGGTTGRGCWCWCRRGYRASLASGEGRMREQRPPLTCSEKVTSFLFFACAG